MKLNGLVGGGTGKLGNSVFSQNAGRTIVRQYQSEVKNPNTDRQRKARERFSYVVVLSKLLSPALAVGMPRVGAETSRNRFARLVLSLNAKYGDAILTEQGFDPADTTAADYTKVPVAVGGMPKPAGITFAVTEATATLTITKGSEYNPTAMGYIPPMAGQPGLVVVVTTGVESTFVNTYVYQTTDVAAGSLTLALPADYAGQRIQIYAFAKWVPESYTPITTTTQPWKYPSDQSDSIYLGSGSLN